MNYWKRIKKNNTPSTTSILNKFINEIKPQSKILEIGCGYGRIINNCISKKCYIYGIDINKNEINALKLKYRDNKNIILEENDITNKDFKLGVNYKFDYIFINGLLGALNLKQRITTLNNILKVTHSKSKIHLSEFLLFEENEEMKVRYLKDLPKTKEYGTFFVYNKEGRKIYQTHNFTESEIKNLVSKNFKILEKKLMNFKSYTNKIKPGIILILQVNKK